MGKVTLYLDPEAAAKVKEAARSAGISQSRWLVETIRQSISKEWPPEIIALAGAWADLPSAEESCEEMPEDLPREPV